MKSAGIIAAMEEEISYIKSNMDVKIVKNALGMEFCVGTLNEINVVAVRSGIGKVNAALCTQVMIDQFPVDYVINTGVAGAISKELEVGDIVISTNLLHHDMDATGFGYERGQIPQMQESIFNAEEELVRIAQEEGKAISGNHQVMLGRIVSGDQFVSDGETKKQIWELFKAACVEMEGAAIAQTCMLNKIPFVVIRSISDKADGDAGITYESFVKTAAKNSADLVQRIIEKY